MIPRAPSVVYPRTYPIRRGVDMGKILVQWGSHGPLMLLSPDGTTETRYKFPSAEMFSAVLVAGPNSEVA